MDEGLDLPAIYNPRNADEVWVIQTKYSFRTLFFRSEFWNNDNNKRRRRRKGQFKYLLVFTGMPKNDGTYIYTMMQKKLQYL